MASYGSGSFGTVSWREKKKLFTSVQSALIQSWLVLPGQSQVPNGFFIWLQIPTKSWAFVPPDIKKMLRMAYLKGDMAD